MNAVIPLPPNNTLIGLPTLLDVDAVREQLNGAGAQVEGGSISYLRYKPKTNCIVAYQFERGDPVSGDPEPAFYYGKCSDPEGYRTATLKARDHKWIQPSTGPAVVPFEDGSALFYAFPNDTQLYGLRILQSPTKLRRFMKLHLSESTDGLKRISRTGLTTDLVRYKPERRAVLRTRTKLVDQSTREPDDVCIYWKVFAKSQAREVHRRMQFLMENLPESSDVRVPEPLGFDPEDRILVMKAVQGQPLIEVLESRDSVAADAVQRTGAALARLHDLSDPNLTPQDSQESFRAVAETKKMLAALSPELHEQVHRLSARLARSVPERTEAPGFVHGDFHYGQVLVGRRRIGLLDFDRSHSGSRLEDLGNFLAHIKLLRLEDRLVDDGNLSRAFLEGYTAGSNRNVENTVLKWWTAISLFFLAVGPFRRLEPNWPEMVKAILDAAEEELC